MRILIDDHRAVYGMPAISQPQVDVILSQSSCSIVIPVFNQSNLTRRSLESLLSVDIPVEVIVVDNGSTDDTQKVLAEFPSVKTIRFNSNVGIPKALNRGFSASTGNFVTCMHNDVFVRDSSWLKETVVKLSLVPDAGVSGFCAIRHIPKAGPLAGRKIYCVDGLCMTFKREVFEAVGGFDEQFSPIGYYDMDICYSLVQKGYKSIVSWSAMKHENHATSKHLDTDWKIYVDENKHKFMQKWGLEEDGQNCVYCKKRLHVSSDLTLKNCYLICENCYLRN